MAHGNHPDLRAVTYRLHKDLVAAVKEAAAKAGVTEKAFVIRALERELARED